MQDEDEKCPVTTTLDILGGKWKAAVLWHLVRKTRRFNELKHLIPDITQKMLTQQLRELEADGLLHRQVYPEAPPHVEYSLTSYGKTLIPVLNSMAEWGLAHEQELTKGLSGDGTQ